MAGVELSSDSVRRLLDIARDAGLGGTFGERMDSLTGALCELVPVTTLSLVVVRGPGGGPAAAPAGEPPPAVFRNGTISHVLEYVERYLPADPMAPAIPRADGGAYVLSDFVTGTRFGRDAFTGEFLPRHGIRHVMASPISLADGRLVLLALHRARSLGDFTPKERELLRLTSPDFARAALATLVGQRLAAAPASGTQADGTCFLKFDERGELASAGGAALALVQELADGPDEAAEALAHGARQLGSALEGTTAERLLPLRHGGAVVVRYTALREGPARRVVAELRTLAGGTPALADCVATLAHLTPRERAAADLAVQGYGNREIAMRLGISAITVGCHLNKVYAKLRVAGRVELASKFLVGGVRPARLPVRPGHGGPGSGLRRGPALA